MEADGESAKSLGGVVDGADVAGCVVGVLLAELSMDDGDAFGGHDALEVGALVRVSVATVDGDVGYLAEEAGAGAEVADGDVDEANLNQLELPLESLDGRHQVVAVLVYHDLDLCGHTNLDELFGLKTEYLSEIRRFGGAKLQPRRKTCLRDHDRPLLPLCYSFFSSTSVPK